MNVFIVCVTMCLLYNCFAAINLIHFNVIIYNAQYEGKRTALRQMQLLCELSENHWPKS